MRAAGPAVRPGERLLVTRVPVWFLAGFNYNALHHTQPEHGGRMDEFQIRSTVIRVV